MNAGPPQRKADRNTVLVYQVYVSLFLLLPRSLSHISNNGRSSRCGCGSSSSGIPTIKKGIGISECSRRSNTTASGERNSDAYSSGYRSTDSECDGLYILEVMNYPNDRNNGPNFRGLQRLYGYQRSTETSECKNT